MAPGRRRRDAGVDAVAASKARSAHQLKQLAQARAWLPAEATEHDVLRPLRQTWKARQKTCIDGLKSLFRESQAPVCCG